MHEAAMLEQQSAASTHQVHLCWISTLSFLFGSGTFGGVHSEIKGTHSRFSFLSNINWLRWITTLFSRAFSFLERAFALKNWAPSFIRCFYVPKAESASNIDKLRIMLIEKGSSSTVPVIAMTLFVPALFLAYGALFFVLETICTRLEETKQQVLFTLFIFNLG